MKIVSGSQFGKYIVDSLIGTGGMAEVWQARDVSSGREVALKVLFSRAPQIRERLFREAHAQSVMHHPNVLSIVEVIDVDGAPGLVLPLVKGTDLGTLLQQHRPTRQEALAIFCAIVDGVGHAHQHGMIHRDLKPSNVLLQSVGDQLVPCICDFGLVKDTNSTTMTRSGLMMGTISYVAPEQILNAAGVDHRADLFSLGVILVELLTGQMLFPTPSLQERLDTMHAQHDLSAVPTALVSLCRALLSPLPQHRPQSCAELMIDLKRSVPPFDHGISADGTIGDLVHRHWGKSQTEDSANSQETLDVFVLSNLPRPAQPPSRLEDSASHQHKGLPQHDDAFLGREAELHVLGELFAAGNLVGVLGSGGMGKTRLALEFARRERHSFRRVFFCSLAEAETMEDIVSCVAQALKVPLHGPNPRSQIGFALANSGRCLLVLDNVEQITTPIEQVVQLWRTQAPDVCFLLTSRVQLDLPWKMLQLLPMDIGLGIRLFVKRAQSHKPSFVRTESNQEAIHKLVLLLDGLPLAIELAAARIAVMTPSTMVSRMDQRFRLLGHTKGGTASRQSTLRQTIDWSWNLLRAEEQDALSQCSLFENGFTLAAAEAVIDLSHTPQQPWTVDVVQSLVDQSLLTAYTDPKSGDTQFGMLMSIREYAQTKWMALDAGLRESVQRKYIDHYASAFSMDSITNRSVNERYKIGIDDVGNLRSAALLALSRQDGEKAAQLILMLVDFVRYGYPLGPLVSMLEQAIPLLPEGGPLWTMVKIEASYMYFITGQLDQSIHCSEQAIAAARHSGNRVQLCLGLINHAFPLRDRGNHALAKMHYKEVLDIGTQCDLPSMMVTAYRLLGQIYVFERSSTQAENALLRAIDMARTMGARREELSALHICAQNQELCGMYEAAEQSYRQSLQLARQVHDALGETQSLAGLGNLCLLQGDLSQSLTLFQQSLLIAQRMGFRAKECMLNGNIGTVYKELNQYPQAEMNYQKALKITREMGVRRGEGIWLLNLGIQYTTQGYYTKAMDFYQDALQIFSTLELRSLKGATLGHIGLQQQILGQVDDAQTNLTAALQIAQTLSDRRSEGAWLRGLGRLAMKQGDLRKCRLLLDKSLLIAQDLNDTLEQCLTLSAMGDLACAHGDWTGAFGHFTAAKNVMGELDVPLEQCHLLCGQVRVALHTGHVNDAKSMLHAAKERIRGVVIGDESVLRRQLDALTDRVQAVDDSHAVEKQ